MGDVKQATAFLARAREVAARINESKDKAWTLREIALAAAGMAAETKNPAVLEQARQVVDASKCKAETLRDIASTVADVAAETKDPALLKPALQLAEWIPDLVDQTKGPGCYEKTFRNVTFRIFSIKAGPCVPSLRRDSLSQNKHSYLQFQK